MNNKKLYCKTLSEKKLLKGVKKTKKRISINLRVSN